jgi:hypothetical protein
MTQWTRLRSEACGPRIHAQLTPPLLLQGAAMSTVLSEVGQGDDAEWVED